MRYAKAVRKARSGSRAGAPGIGELMRRNEELRVRLEEAEETLQAIARGEVDALVVSTPSGENVFTLEGADRVYRVLIEEMGEGALLLSPDGTVLYANRRFSNLVALPPGKAAGANLYSFIEPDAHSGLSAFLSRGLAGSAREEFHLKTVSGDDVPAFLSATPLPGDGPPAICVVVTDLTARKRAETALKESEERFRTVVEHSPVGIFIVQDENVLYRNPEQERLFGGPAGILPFGEYGDVHPEDRERFRKLCSEDCGNERDRVATDLRFFPRGGEGHSRALHFAHCRATSIRFRGRRAVLVNMTNVTQAKEMEQMVLHRERLASLGHVAAGMAHEIRNPLSGLNIYLQAAEKLLVDTERLDPETLDQARLLFGTAKAASDRIEGVIRRIMNYSRPAPVVFAPVQVNDAVREAVGLAAVTLRKNRIGIEVRLAERLPRCRADLRLVEQVVLNLVTNASQAMEGVEGGRRIEIATFLEERHVVIRVADSGPGVPEALREKIFEPFYTTRSGGTGIGLSFSRSVMADHGGFLEAETSPLGGAAFRIGLPVAEAGSGA